MWEVNNLEFLQHLTCNAKMHAAKLLTEYMFILRHHAMLCATSLLAQFQPVQSDNTVFKSSGWPRCCRPLSGGKNKVKSQTVE